MILVHKTQESRFQYSFMKQYSTNTTQQLEMKKFGFEKNSQETPKCTSANEKATIRSKSFPHRQTGFHLQQNQVKLTVTMSQQQSVMREKLLKWVTTQCKRTLELRHSTVEHCIRLFDFYQHCCGKMEELYDGAKLTLITCLFISSKYEEIYPPSVTDFEYAAKYKFSAGDILEHEFVILKKIEYQLVIPLASEWYFYLFEEQAPEWILFCYPVLQPSTSMCNLAKSVRKFTEQNKSHSLDLTIEKIIKQVK